MNVSRLALTILFASTASWAAAFPFGLFGSRLPDKKPVTVQTDGARLTLAAPGDGMGVVSLVHKARGAEFIQSPKAAGDALLWKIEMTSDLADSKAFFGLTNRNDTGETRARRRWGKTILTWEDLDLPGEPDALDVEVTIGPKGPDGMSEWRIDVDNRSERAGVFRVIFPVLEFGRIGKSGDDDFLLLPPAEGRTVRRPIRGEAGKPSGEYWEVATDGEPETRSVVGDTYGFGAQRPHGLPYPSGRGQMQFCAYYEKPGGDFYYPSRQACPGLYWAAYDSAPSPKVFFATPDAARGVVTFEMAHYPEESAAVGEDYDMPYPFVLGAFEGDWFDASGRYRRWALEQDWTEQGPLHDRDDLATWLKTCACVLAVRTRTMDFERAVELAKRYRRDMEGSILLHWYQWANGERDENRPAAGAFPPVAEADDKNFEDLVEDLAKHDMIAMPYFNTRLWETNREGYDEMFVSRHRDGSLDMYGGGKDQIAAGVMCLQLSFWQLKLANLAKEIAVRYSLQALYLDQASGGYFSGTLTPDPEKEKGGCYAMIHPHPRGVTRSLVEAEHDKYALILDKARDWNDGFFLTGEGSDETMIDLFQGKFVAYPIWPEAPPVYSRVYHDYQTFFGSTCPLGADNADDPGPAMGIGWQLVTGLQIGRLSLGEAFKLDKGDKVVARNWEFLKQATQVRSRFSHYLVMGQMLRPPYLLTEVPSLTTDKLRKNIATATLPAILMSTWRAPTGTVGVVCANVSQKPLEFEFALDRADLGFKEKTLTFRRLYPELSSVEAFGGPTRKAKIELDGLSVALYEVKAMPRSLYRETFGPSEKEKKAMEKREAARKRKEKLAKEKAAEKLKEKQEKERREKERLARKRREEQKKLKEKQKKETERKAKAGKEKKAKEKK